MRIKIPAALAWALLAVSWSWPASLPGWAEPLARLPLEKYDTTEIHAVCLLDEAEYLVEADGQATFNHRLAYRILTPEAISLGTKGFAVSERSKLDHLEAAIEYPNGEVVVLKNKDAVETQLSDILFSDVKTRIIALPDVVKGSFICFEYRTKSRRESSALTWWFQSGYPCRMSQLRVRTPISGKPSWKVYPAGLLQPREEGRDLVFTRSNVPALPAEKLAPAMTEYAERVEIRLRVPVPVPPVVNLDTWEEMALWYRKMTAELWSGGPGAAQQAAEICRGSASPEEETRRLCRWVQGQLRYVAIAIGDGGFVPHAPDDVCRNRYGDCKDKTFLLMAMLRSRGIRCWPVLCRPASDGEIDPDWFSPFSFNHCILALEKTPGEYRFFDSTSTEVGYPYLPESLENTWGLLVQEDGGRVVRLQSGCEPLLSIEVQARLAPGGKLSARVTESYRPNTFSSLRAQLRNLNEEERRASWQRILANHQPGTRLTAFQIENLFEPELDLTLRYELELPDAFKHMGQLKLMRPLVVPDLEFPALPDKPRRAPLDLRPLATAVKYQLRIELPPGLTLEEGLEPLDLRADFGRFAIRMEVQSATLELTKEFSFQNMRLGAERADELRKFLAQVRNVQDSEIVLTGE